MQILRHHVAARLLRDDVAQPTWNRPGSVPCGTAALVVVLIGLYFLFFGTLFMAIVGASNPH